MAEVKLIEIDIGEKKFNSQGPLVLNDLELQIKSGEFACLIGPSGVGKSTLLNIISGLDTDYEGTCSFNNDANLGYIFQEPRLMPWLSVAENIALVCDKPDYDEINHLIEAVGLEGKSTSYPAQLSGGMQRRVALVRAFIVKPELLLLDEPFVSLDEPSANKLRKQLERLWRVHKPTVLFVTHNLREAIMLADRLIFLCKAPASVLYEKKIDLPRPRFECYDAVDGEANSILNQYPAILSGSL